VKILWCAAVLLVWLWLMAGPAAADRRKAAASGLSAGPRARVAVEAGARTARALPQHRPPLVRLRSGPGWRVRRPSRAWGTPLAVARLREALSAYGRRFPGAPPIHVHDLSARSGGPLPRHTSHRDGRDADIRLVLRRPAAGYVAATPRTLHRRRTWFLLLSLLSSCDVEFVLLDRRLQRALYGYALARGWSPRELGLVLQYPRRGPRGMVRHFPRHQNHLHVRFRPRPGVRAPAPRIPTDYASLEALCGGGRGGGRPLASRLLQRL
jgi:hypothetical protein